MFWIETSVGLGACGSQGGQISPAEVIALFLLPALVVVFVSSRLTHLRRGCGSPCACSKHVHDLYTRTTGSGTAYKRCLPLRREAATLCPITPEDLSPGNRDYSLHTASVHSTQWNTPTLYQYTVQYTNTVSVHSTQ